jgi:hypothetical protein
MRISKGNRSRLGFVPSARMSSGFNIAQIVPGIECGRPKEFLAASVIYA